MNVEKEKDKRASQFWLYYLRKILAEGKKISMKCLHQWKNGQNINKNIIGKTLKTGKCETNRSIYFLSNQKSLERKTENKEKGARKICLEM